MKNLKTIGVLFLMVSLGLALLVGCPEPDQKDEKVTVTFDADGGSPTPGNVVLDKGSSLGDKYPANVTKEGHFYFDGWYEGNTKYAKDTPINKSLTLMAHWGTVSEDQVIVTFDPDGGSPTPENVVLEKGSSLGDEYPANVEKEGHYYFDGWYSGEMEYARDTPINEDITLTAQWAEVSASDVIVKFDLAGGKTADDNTTLANVVIEKGTSMGDKYPANPGKVEYSFGGWFNGNTKYDSETVIDGDITLTAKWNPLVAGNVVIKFLTNGGSSAPAEVSIPKGASMGDSFPPAPTKNYNTFQGWFNSGTQYTRDTPINDDITLTAQWVAEQVTITFSTDGGGANPANVIIDRGTSMGTRFPAATPRKDGFHFDGWYSGATQYTSSTNVTAQGTLALTAKWTKESLVTKWKLIVPAETTATEHATYQGKNDVLQIAPKPSYNWAPLQYSLSAYNGQTVTISVSMDVWLETATRINWQVNQDDYPTIAGATSLTTGAWHTVSGSEEISLESNKMLYLSSGTYGLSDVPIYIANLVITVKLPGASEDPEDMLNLPALKEQFADYFLLGNIAVRGDAGTGANAAITNNRLLHHYNVLTAENDMKPDSYGGSRNASNNTVTGLTYTNSDRFVNAATNSGFKILAHVLLWHNQTPQWQKNMANVDAADAKATMEDYITQVVTHFKGKIWAWDVLNEIFPDNINAANWKTDMRKANDSQAPNPWFVAMGYDFVYYAYKAARAADGDAILYYNDYNLDSTSKSTAVFNMVKDANDRWAVDADNPEKAASATAYTGRKLIEGIGMQSHHNTNVTAAQIKLSLDRFKPLGVKISISELDVLSGGYKNAFDTGPNKASEVASDEDRTRAATFYYNYFKLFMDYSEKNGGPIERVTFWGINDEASWRSAGEPLPFKGSSPSMAKPAYFRIIDALEGR